MIFQAEREAPPVRIRAQSRYVSRELAQSQSILTKTVIVPAIFWRSCLPRKVMVLSYFAESKGLVGCSYHRHLAFKVR